MKATKPWTIAPCSIILSSVTPAHAATGGAHGTPLLGWLFIAFGCLIILSQLIPGIMLFASMIKGMLASQREGKEMHPASSGADTPSGLKR